MAYAFNGSNQFLSSSSFAGVGFNEPLTLSCIFYPSTTGRTLISLGPPDNQSLGYLLRISAVAQSKIIAAKNEVNVTGPTTISLNTWNHGAGVFSSDTSKTCYLNGEATADTVTSTADATGTAFTALGIGRSHTTGANTRFWSGRIAEVGIWTAALAAEEILSLSRGMSPDMVRPSSLVFYAPLIRNLQDVRGGQALTNNAAATVINHPRIYH